MARLLFDNNPNEFTSRAMDKSYFVGIFSHNAWFVKISDIEIIVLINDFFVFSYHKLPK